MAAPERWDEACFAAPAVRALMASGLKVGVICLPEQREFWQTLRGLEVIERPRKARQLAAELAGSWQAALLWEDGFAADAVMLANIPRRLGPAAGKLRKQLTHPLTAGEKPLDHRVRFYLSALEEMGIATSDPEFFAPADIGIASGGESGAAEPGIGFRAKPRVAAGSLVGNRAQADRWRASRDGGGHRRPVARHGGITRRRAWQMTWSFSGRCRWRARCPCSRCMPWSSPRMARCHISRRMWAPPASRFSVRTIRSGNDRSAGVTRWCIATRNVRRA